MRALLDAPPVTIVPTGLSELDRLCGGGLPLPWRLILVGMPSAWKTGMAVYLADRLERADGPGLYVGILAIDEEPEDVAVRFAQMSDFDRVKLQRQDREELTAAADDLADAHIALYGLEHTIESAAWDLYKRASDAGKRAVFVVDSLQTARSKALADKASPSPRDVVEANVAAFRWVTSTYRMLGIATSEANRAAYRDGAAAMQVGLAAGAESRSIEYAAQTLIVLQADQNEPDTLFHAEVAKNRARLKGAFSFRLNREAHTITEVEGGQLKEDRREAKRAERRGTQQADAVAVAQELRAAPGLTTNRLHAALRERHGSFSEGRATAGLRLLGDGVERRAGEGRSVAHHLVPAKLPAFVLEALPKEQAAA
jgi:KaiC/GvpD/RAD55 family RecA-like ATPase